MVSAPPSPAENAAIAARITLMKGSRALIIRHALSAWTRAGLGFSPAASATLAHSKRMARNLESVTN